MEDYSELDAYLGDGVYASFDGYHIWIKVHDQYTCEIALEPDVLDNLIRYRQTVVNWLSSKVAQNEAT